MTVNVYFTKTTASRQLQEIQNKTIPKTISSQMYKFIMFLPTVVMKYLRIQKFVQESSLYPITSPLYTLFIPTRA